jgi:adenylate kinase
LRFKVKTKRPKRISNILICGPPGSGRSTIARAISKRYGFVYVSS